MNDRPAAAYTAYAITAFCAGSRLGKACDVFPGKGGVLPTSAQKAAGDALAAALQASAAQTGVHYLIWYGQIWSVDRAGEGWRRYDGGGIYDPGDITGGHYDHIHISVY